MAPPDWRNPEDYEAIARLDLASLAWEFLRRNPQYRLEHRGVSWPALGPDRRGLSPRWGLRFPVPPELAAAEAPLFWRADVAPAHVVILTRSALGGLSGRALAGLSLARRQGEDGLHLRFAGGLQALVPAGLDLAEPLAAQAALDPELAVRLTALDALQRRLRGLASSPASLSIHARRRAGLMVRALDGRAEGASYRDIAAHVLGAAPDPLAWRTSTARDVAIRLCRSARRFMGGGYQMLLRRRR
jgi:hypothetical protein